MKFVQQSLICDDAVPWFAPFLDHTIPSQSVVEQNFPDFICTILPGIYVRACHSEIIKHGSI